MGLVVRAGSAADIETVREIAYATWPDAFREILTPAQITYMLEWLYASPRLHAQVASGEHILHIAELDRAPVGFVAHQLNHPAAGNTKIHKIYLLPETQGKGVGRAMFDVVLLAARAASQSSMTLNVNKYNRAVGFYEAIGFVRAAEEVIEIGGGYVMDDFVMRFTLDGA